MKKLNNYIINEKIYFILIVLLLSPIVFYPISSDIAIFIRAGKVIANGGLIYSDFIDLKPPGFYFLYSIIYRIFTDNIILLRLFDLIIQTTTVILIYHFLKDIFTKKEAYLAGILYSISYVGINYNQTMNSESFLGVSIISLLILNKNNIDFKSVIFSGLLIGLNTGFKFTFGLILPAYLLYIILNLNNNLKQKIRFLILSSIAFFFTFFLTLTPLLIQESFNGFKIILSYLNFHSSNPPFDMSLIKFGIKETGVFLGDNYSILLSISLFIGIFIYITKNNIERNSLILLIFIFLLLSVVWERKFSIYHFSRIYSLFSIFSGIGLVFIYYNVKKLFYSTEFTSKFAIIFFSTFLVVLSPVTRYTKSLIPIKHFLTDKNKYFEFYELPNDNLNLLKTYKQTADLINKNANDNNKCVVIAIGAETINYYLKPSLQKSIFAHSLFYYGNFVNKEWYLEFNNEIKNADFIVIQLNDIHPLLTQHNYTSKELLEKDTDLYQYLNDNFNKIEVINCFEIYKRK